jgi:hypothetical protein
MLRAALPFIVAAASTNCKEKAPHSGSDSKVEAQGAAVRASQVNMWYQTMAAMARERYESTASYQEAVNLAIVENYFPLYLQQLREGEVNESHLRIAASAYSMLPEAARIKMPIAKTVSEDSFRLISDTGVLSSFGYTEEDISSVKKFNSLRRAYLETLESKNQNKPEMAKPRKPSD